jgi:Short C-terminal domain
MAPISKTVTWTLDAPLIDASGRFRAALESIGGTVRPDGADELIEADTPRKMRKNRWATRVQVALAENAGGQSTATITLIPRMGSANNTILEELAETTELQAIKLEQTKLPSNWSQIRDDQEAAQRRKDEELVAETFANRPAPRVDHESVELSDYAKLKDKVRTELEDNLGPEETIRVIIRGAHDQAMVGTDSRVFVCKPGFMAGATFGVEVASWNYRNLTGVQRHKSRMGGSVLLQAPGQTGQETSYWASGPDAPKSAPNAIPVAGDWKQIDAGVARLRQLIDQAQSQSSAGAGPTQPSTADELRKLAQLYRQNLLTADEFQAAKSRLLEG